MLLFYIGTHTFLPSYGIDFFFLFSKLPTFLIFSLFLLYVKPSRRLFVSSPLRVFFFYFYLPSLLCQSVSVIPFFFFFSSQLSIFLLFPFPFCTLSSGHYYSVLHFAINFITTSLLFSISQVPKVAPVAAKFYGLNLFLHSIFDFLPSLN